MKSAETKKTSLEMFVSRFWSLWQPRTAEYDLTGLEMARLFNILICISLFTFTG